MSTLNSPLRRFLKPVISRLASQRVYQWLHTHAKIRDIGLGLVREPEVDVLGWFLHSGEEAIDVGANFGYYAVPLSRLCAKVYAFEPIPGTHDTCRKVLRHFRARNVELISSGVGEKAGTVRFEVPLQDNGTPNAGQARFAGRKDATPESGGSRFVECSVVALGDPQWLERFGNVTFVKLDIEGAELYALRGMRALLARDRPVVQLEISPAFLRGFGVTEKDLREFAGATDYSFYRYHAEAGAMVPAEEDFTDGNYFLLQKSHVTRLADEGRLGAAQ
jgi:FkbM family methyltransferase